MENLYRIKKGMNVAPPSIQICKIRVEFLMSAQDFNI